MIEFEDMLECSSRYDLAVELILRENNILGISFTISEKIIFEKRNIYRYSLYSQYIWKKLICTALFNLTRLFLKSV